MTKIKLKSSNITVQFQTYKIFQPVLHWINLRLRFYASVQYVNFVYYPHIILEWNILQNSIALNASKKLLRIVNTYIFQKKFALQGRKLVISVDTDESV